MKSEKKYWKELVSLIDPAFRESELPSVMDPVTTKDYQWLVKTRQQLKQVFYSNDFNKQTAKVRLEQRVQNNYEKVSFQLMKTVWFRVAIILIAIISGAFLNTLIDGIVQEKSFTEITVPPGQMTQIKLPDGSKVWLNSGSVFKYSNEFDHSSREVYIDGEAFLEVAKDTRKPFRVNANKFSVEVMGTTFNITAYSNENKADVTLVEGLVQIKSESNPKSNRIVPGQCASIVDGDLKLITKVNTEFFTSWKEGKIVFRKETLEQIAKKLERWYNVEIRFADEDLKKLVYSGTLLKYKPVEQVFKSFILLNKDVDFASENRIDKKNIIYIKKKEIIKTKL